MGRPRRAAAVTAAAALVAFILAVSVAGTADAAGARYGTTEQAVTVPAVTLLDRHGEEVTLDALLAAHDGPVAVQFVFTTCPAICPVLTGTFATLGETLGPRSDDLLRVSISIDPETDRPERLDAYAERFRAGPSWRFLTGSRSSVDRVLAAFDAGFANKMEHRPLTILRGGPGTPWVRIEGFPRGADLAAEVRRAAGWGA